MIFLRPIRSASRSKTISELHSINPALMAPPLPTLFSSSITFTPCFFAILAVLSHEPSLTTIISLISGDSDTTSKTLPIVFPHCKQE